MKRIAFILVYPLLLVVSRLPFWLLYVLSDALFVLVYRVIGYRKKVVRKNLELVGLAKTTQEQLRIEKTGRI